MPREIQSKVYVEHMHGGTIGASDSVSNPPKILTPKIGTKYPSFTGREKELKEIDTKLASSDALLLVNGIGGIGKSLLAGYYCAMQTEHFDHIAFIEISKDFRGDFVSSLQSALKIKSEKREDAFAEALQKLQNLEGTKLLVLDDIKATDTDVLQDILSLGHNGYKILMTSRDKLPDIPHYRLETLSPEEARELFLKHCKTEQINLVDKLLKYIDYHTLFIDRIAKMVAVEEYDLGTLVREFEEGALTKIVLTDQESGDEITLGKHLRELFSLQTLDETYILLLKKLATLPSVSIDKAFLKEYLATERVLGKLNFLANRGWLIKTDDTFKPVSYTHLTLPTKA